MTDSDGNELYTGFWSKNEYHGEGRLNNISKEIIEGKIDWNSLTDIDNGWSTYEGIDAYIYF